MFPQRRVSGDVDFARGWDEYEQGFGDFGGDFWFGLDKIHSVCNVVRVYTSTRSLTKK